MESKLSRALAPKRPDAPTLTSRQLVKAWWQALRPPFFIGDPIPVGLGGALAARDLGYWPWGIFAVVMVGCFCLHTVANIANDLFDYLEGVDTDETIGGTKVIQNGWISPRQICLRAAVFLNTVLLQEFLLCRICRPPCPIGVGACGLCRALRRLLRRAAHTLRVPGIRRAVRMPEYGIYHGYGLLCGNGERLFGAEPCPGASRGAHGGGDSLLSKPA